MTMTEAYDLGSITTDDALILRDEFKEADAEAVNERMRSLSPEEQARLLVLQELLATANQPGYQKGRAGEGEQNPWLQTWGCSDSLPRG